MGDTSVTEMHVNALFNKSALETIKMGSKTTVVHCTLPNGFTIVESSSCVDPANYNHELGQNLCFRRIKDKIWELEGYLLQQEKYEESLEAKIKPIEPVESEQPQAVVHEGLPGDPVIEESQKPVKPDMSETVTDGGQSVQLEKGPHTEE